MSNYVKSYWSLYLDFLQLFQSVRYRNIPLAILPNFHGYLSKDIKQAMDGNKFSKRLNYKEINESQLHQLFEKYISDVKIKQNRKYLKQGRILYNHPIPKKYSQVPHIEEVLDYKKKIKKILSTQKNHPVFSGDFFKEKLVENVDKMIATIIKCDEFLKNEGKDIRAIAIITAEPMTSRVLSIFSKIYGIPTFCLQHGAIMGDEAFFPLFTDYELVYGHYEKSWYTRKGVDPERVVITGYSKYDRIWQKPIVQKDLVCRELGLTPNKKIILIPTQPFDESLYVQMSTGLARDKNVQVVIKPHPLEIRWNSIEGYRAISNKYPNVVLFDKGDLYDILPHMDLVAIQNSTVGLEAMLFGVPVISYKKSNSREYKYYDLLGEFVEQDMDKFISKVFRILSDPLYRAKADQGRINFLKYAYPQKMSTTNSFIIRVT